MAMAHGVEGRFPFLDHRLFALAASLPDGAKLRGLREKEILRRWAVRAMPAAVANRPKQPYRAPDVPAFFAGRTPAYVEEALSPEALERTNLFDPRAVAGLLRRCRAGRAIGFRENQALVAVLSTQLWHRQWFEGASAVNSVGLGAPDVAIRLAGSRSRAPHTSPLAACRA